MPIIAIIELESGIQTLSEGGVNVLHKDCLRFGMAKTERRELLIYLRQAVAAFRECDEELLKGLLEGRYLKKLERQKKAREENLWEVRKEGRGARILFMRLDSNAVVVAAVEKGAGSLSQAVNRGVNRWRDYLKTKGK